MKKALRAIVKAAILFWFKTYYRVKIIGTENIPKEGPVIFCGNHTSYMDPPLMVVTGKRNMRFLAKVELKEKKPMAFLMWIFDAIMVNRNEKDVSAIKTSLKELKDGGAIALFPEGTRNGMEKGEKAKDGVAFLATRSGAKIVPCGIKGGTKEHRQVTITYGKPLDYSELKGSKDKEQLDKITEEVMNNIIALKK